MAKVIDNDNPYDLNAKQLLFCDSYLQCFNATQAYIDAYKVQYKTAHSNCNRMMANDGIKKELKRRQKIVRKNAYIKAEDVFNKIVSIAFSDISKYIDFGHSIQKERDLFGNPVRCPETKDYITYIKNYIKAKDSKRIDPSVIQEISSGKDGFKIKLADKKWALEFLIKYFELDKDSQHKKEIDKKRLELEEKRIKIDESLEDDKESIKEFINLVKAEKTELNKVFEEEIKYDSKK